MTQFLLYVVAAGSFPIAAFVITKLVSRDVDRVVSNAQKRTTFGGSAPKH